MSDISFSESYLPNFENDPVVLACYKAREILGAFMLEGIDVALEEIPEAAEYSEIEVFDVDGEIFVEDDAILHETTYIEINDGQRINISNRPFIVDNENNLHSYTWPGYVAIHIEFKDAPPTYSPPKLEDSDQIIFRLPYAGSPDDAAIFRGFDMTPESRIDTDPVELAAVIELLEMIRFSYIQIITSEEGYWQSTYLSQTPEDIEFALSNQFPEEDL